MSEGWKKGTCRYCGGLGYPHNITVDGLGRKATVCCHCTGTGKEKEGSAPTEAKK